MLIFEVLKLQGTEMNSSQTGAQTQTMLSGQFWKSQEQGEVAPPLTKLVKVKNQDYFRTII